MSLACADPNGSPEPRPRALLRVAALTCTLAAASGCWAPLCSKGIPAHELPDTFRMPMRACAPELILSALSQEPRDDYRLGRGDLLEVIVPGLFPRDELHALRVQVTGDGRIQLPLVGPVSVEGMTLSEAQAAITTAYADGFLQNPRVSIILLEPGGVDVVVLGYVNRPGTYTLPRGQNDLSHAIAAAEGLRDDAGTVIELHRRALPEFDPPPFIQQQAGWSDAEQPVLPLGEAEEAEAAATAPGAVVDEALVSPLPAAIDFILRIPLKGDLTPTLSTPDGTVCPVGVTRQDMVLRAGDVINVPEEVQDTFYVVGPLSPANFVRFSVRDEDREVGNGFLLPPNRDIDVVTAVTMAGYIDPINSPTTVTVHRMQPGQPPFLILVDLIKARYDHRENIYVEPGDIIYLNPDAPWYFRRLFDRIVDSVLIIPYNAAVNRSINP